MSLLDFYSELFPGNLATWMIGGTVLIGVIILVENFFGLFFCSSEKPYLKGFTRNWHPVRELVVIPSHPFRQGIPSSMAT